MFVRCVCVWEQKVTALVVAHGNMTNREVSHPSGHRETTQLHFLFLLRKHIFNVALKVCRGLRYLGEGWWWWGGAIGGKRGSLDNTYMVVVFPQQQKSFVRWRLLLSQSFQPDGEKDSTVLLIPLILLPVLL